LEVVVLVVGVDDVVVELVVVGGAAVVGGVDEVVVDDVVEVVGGRDVVEVVLVDVVLVGVGVGPLCAPVTAMRRGRMSFARKLPTSCASSSIWRLASGAHNRATTLARRPNMTREPMDCSTKSSGVPSGAGPIPTDVPSRISPVTRTRAGAAASIRPSRVTRRL